MAKAEWQGAIQQIVKGISQMVEDKLSKTTKIYDALVIKNNNDGTWNLQYNGNIHAVKPYGTVSPTIGKTVKVFIPQGNQNLSFFI